MEKVQYNGIDAQRFRKDQTTLLKDEARRMHKNLPHELDNYQPKEVVQQLMNEDQEMLDLYERQYQHEEQLLHDVDHLRLFDKQLQNHVQQLEHNDEPLQHEEQHR